MIFPHATHTNLQMVTEAILRSEAKVTVDIAKHMDYHSGWDQATRRRTSLAVQLVQIQLPTFPTFVTNFGFLLRVTLQSLSKCSTELLPAFYSSWNRIKCGWVYRRPALTTTA